MVVEALLNWLLGGLGWLLDAFTGAVDFSAVSLSSVFSNLLAMNYWLPLAELAQFVGVFVLAGPANLSISLTSWILFGVLRGGAPKA